MARKDGEIAVDVIDDKVQSVFSFIESVLNKYNIFYDLHSTATFNLFPKINHPRLINMSRFETRNDIGLGSNIENFSKNLQQILEKNELDPKIIGFSVVPQHPIISGYDAYIINSLSEEIASWYFKGARYKKIDVTVRSNLISRSLFNSVSNLLFEADETHLKKLIEDKGILLKKHDEEKLMLQFGKEKLYYNEYEGRIRTHRLIIKNRVIGNQKHDDLMQANIRMAEELYVRFRRDADIAIAPKGVMLQHSSLSINNPILWLSHYDFYQNLYLFTKKYKDNFSMRNFINEIVLQNIVIYKVINKGKSVGEKIKNEDFKGIFEANRKYFLKRKKII